MNFGVTAEEEVVKAAEENIQAMRDSDAQFLERSISDSFLGIGPLGEMMTKQAWLAGHHPSVLKYSELHVQDKRVRVYGSSVAILTARQVSSASVKGRVAEGDFRVTEVFVNQGGRWLLANRQLSPCRSEPL
jgi:Domain of unknown function (DUF4440)